MSADYKKDVRCLSFIGLLVLIVAFLSCETSGPECYEPVNVQARSVFVYADSIDTVYTVETDTNSYLVDTTIFRSGDLFPLASSFEVIDVDSHIVVNGYGTSSVGVPLNALADSVRYRYRVDTGSTLYDTLTFYYNSLVHFISNSCGYTYYFTLNSVRSTNNFTDSAVLSDVNVNNQGQSRHVLRYLRN